MTYWVSVSGSRERNSVARDNIKIIVSRWYYSPLAIKRGELDYSTDNAVFISAHMLNFSK